MVVRKRTWTVDEIEQKFKTADAKTRWSMTQIQSLLDRIALLEHTVEAREKKISILNKVISKTSDTTKLDDLSVELLNELGIKLPKSVTTRKK